MPAPTRQQPAPLLDIVSGPPGGYVPGVCNIGPWEIRRRRRFAILGFAAAAALFVLLVVTHAPVWSRFLVLLPAWSGAFSWLQARRRFCAGFAMAGITNFTDGESGRQAVTDPAARRADMAATARMTRDSLLLALPVAVVAVLLPV
jgi:hypothetical protein